MPERRGENARTVERIGRRRRGCIVIPLASPAPRPASHAQRRVANADAFIERIAAGLMLLAVIATFTLSSSVLTNWKIHYLTAGGNFYEKLHPATYFTLLAFSLLLIRSRGPIGEINRMFSESKLLLAYLLCWLFLLIQVIVLERPFTVIIDTFLLPILIAMVMWQLVASAKAPAGLGDSPHDPAERRARIL